VRDRRIGIADAVGQPCAEVVHEPPDPIPTCASDVDKTAATVNGRDDSSLLVQLLGQPSMTASHIKDVLPSGVPDLLGQEGCETARERVGGLSGYDCVRSRGGVPERDVFV
jgi:hypothetical protein